MEGSASLLLFVLQVGVVVGTVLGHQPCTSANLDAPRMAVDIDQEISADRIRIRHAMLVMAIAATHHPISTPHPCILDFCIHSPKIFKRIEAYLLEQTDVPEMQRINCICLPENYHRESYWMHILRWPSIVHVAEARVRSSCSSRGADGTQDDGWAVVAYVLAKMQDDDGNEQDRQALAPDADRKGHITSLAVMRSHRRLGIAKRLCSLLVDYEA